VVDLMEALRRSVGQAGAAEPKSSKKPSRRRSSGQKEMLMPIEGKKQSKAAAGKKATHKPQRKSA
jgi:DNA end-binding protein Ku